MTRRQLSLALALFISACAAPFRVPTPDEQVELMRAADTFDWAMVESQDLALRLTGTCAMNAREEPFTFWLTQDGRYRLNVEGVLGSEEVFDGTTVQRRDFSGLSEPLEGLAAELAPRLAWLLTGGWAPDVVGVRGEAWSQGLRARRGADGYGARSNADLLGLASAPETLVELELDSESGTLRTARALDSDGDPSGAKLTFEGWSWVDVPLPRPVTLHWPLPARAHGSGAPSLSMLCTQGHSGAVVGANSDRELYVVHLHFEDQAPRPLGLAVPTAFATYSEHTGELESRFEVAEATLVPLAEANLVVRKVPPTGMRFQGDAPISVPLRRLPTGHLVVPVRIDGGAERVFLFDTGAGATVVDLVFAEEAGLEVLGDVDAVGVSGAAAAHFVQARSLSLGGPGDERAPEAMPEPIGFDTERSSGRFVWDEPVLVALEFGDIAQALGAPIVGILGYDFIARCQVELDAEHLRVWPYDREVAAQAGWHSVPLTIQGKVPSAWATFPTQQGEVGGWFRIDTGDNGSVTFHGPAIEEHGLLAGRETSPISFGGVGGSSFGYVAEFEWLELGDLRVGPLEAGFAIQAEGTFGQSDLAGNIGQGILGRYDVRLDYSRRQMALRERVVEGEPSE